MKKDANPTHIFEVIVKESTPTKIGDKTYPGSNYYILAKKDEKDYPFHVTPSQARCISQKLRMFVWSFKPEQIVTIRVELLNSFLSVTFDKKGSDLKTVFASILDHQHMLIFKGGRCETTKY